MIILKTTRDCEFLEKITKDQTICSFKCLGFYIVQWTNKKKFILSIIYFMM